MYRRVGVRELRHADVVRLRLVRALPHRKSRIGSERRHHLPQRARAPRTRHRLGQSRQPHHRHGTVRARRLVPAVDVGDVVNHAIRQHPPPPMLGDDPKHTNTSSDHDIKTNLSAWRQPTPWWRPRQPNRKAPHTIDRHHTARRQSGLCAQRTTIRQPPRTQRRNHHRAPERPRLPRHPPTLRRSLPPSRKSGFQMPSKLATKGHEGLKFAEGTRGQLKAAVRQSESQGAGGRSESSNAGHPDPRLRRVLPRRRRCHDGRICACQ